MQYSSMCSPSQDSTFRNSSLKRMISKEAAIKLKAAGWPQNGEYEVIYYDLPVMELMALQHIKEKEEELNTHAISGPSLGQLIEACEGENGQRFRWLKNHGHGQGWLAQARPAHPQSGNYPDAPQGFMPKDPRGSGATPEDAAAELWIALQTK